MSKKIEHRTVNGIEHKRCPKCKTYQPLDQFCKGKSWDGLSGHCYSCQKEWREKNKERLAQYNKSTAKRKVA